MMAIFESQTLRDLIQNNIDYVAKQVGVINDFLFGETSDGTDDIPQMPYILHTCQLFGCNPHNFNIDLSWTQFAVANVDLDVSGLHIRCFDSLRSDYNGAPNQMAQVDSIMLPYLSTYSYDATLDEMGVDFLYNSDQFIQGSKDGNVVYPVYYDSVFNGISGHQQLQLALSPKQTYSYRGNICDTWNVASYFFSDRFYFQQIDSNNYPSRLVMLPNPSSRASWRYIDNSTVQTINYNGDTIYNYYNDSGDIIINGGGGTLQSPIAPIGGLAYADVKFILDSLIDDLNLHFDFAADGVAPLAPAPTLDEIRYGDYSSFYIEKIHQLKALHNAPDLADTVIDISEPLGILNDGFDGVLGAFDALGITLMVSFTFIARLCIRKLRGE